MSIRPGSTPQEGGEVASEGVRDEFPSRSSSIGRGHRRPGHAEPTTTRNVEPKTWALARHSLVELATLLQAIPQARAWTTREGPAIHQPVIGSISGRSTAERVEGEDRAGGDQ